MVTSMRPGLPADTSQNAANLRRRRLPCARRPGPGPRGGGYFPGRHQPPPQRQRLRTCSSFGPRRRVLTMDAPPTATDPRLSAVERLLGCGDLDRRRSGVPSMVAASRLTSPRGPPGRRRPGVASQTTHEIWTPERAGRAPLGTSPPLMTSSPRVRVHCHPALDGAVPQRSSGVGLSEVGAEGRAARTEGRDDRWAFPLREPRGSLALLEACLDALVAWFRLVSRRQAVVQHLVQHLTAIWGKRGSVTVTRNRPESGVAGRLGTTKPQVRPGLTCGFGLWPGAGSNRRPSDFQSDARTN
jgi:hypothetical protein